MYNISNSSGAPIREVHADATTESSENATHERDFGKFSCSTAVSTGVRVREVHVR